MAFIEKIIILDKEVTSSLSFTLRGISTHWTPAICKIVLLPLELRKHWRNQIDILFIDIDRHHMFQSSVVVTFLRRKKSSGPLFFGPSEMALTVEEEDTTS